VERTDLGRIVAFTDGVMAVAITLLVLNLEVPQVPGGDLTDALVDLIPSLIAYVLAFALVGRFWVLHHRLFERLSRFDDRLMAMNLTFLALIALVPFATDLYDEYTKEAVAAALFGLLMGLAALVHWTMNAHTLRRGYVHDAHRPAAEPAGSLGALSFAGIFLLSVPVAFLSTTVAALLWTGTILLHIPLGRRS
jgi:uncharacterized membrane protein